ncbi:MAG TPA: DHA2 family efflux MFS transporter permease subunit [Spirochaetia bacterium]|nr:DHA2 family efflux MFS transporter permease subunit [Spirochaetia bacterium]
MSDQTAGRRDSPVNTIGTGPQAGQSGYHWLAPVLVALIGAFMSILDTSIVNVATPTMMNVFNADPSEIQWVSTIYMLALGVVIPLSGWLGDLMGFKRLYIISMGTFVAGSLLCALAWDLNSLIAARVIQAVGGGMIMPTTMAMIYRMVPRDKIGSGMGIFGIALLVAPAIGPTLGGYLVEYVDWRWIFTINLPIGVIGILLAFFVLPEFQSKHPGKLDVGGAITAAAALFCLLLALTKGSDWGWGDEKTVLLFCASFFSFVLFIYLELTSDNPLLDLRVFRYPSFTLANLTIVVTMIGLFSGLFFLPLFLQSIRGIGAMQTGLLMLPGALVSGLMMPIIGRLFDKIGARPLVITGLLLMAFITFLYRNLNLATATSTIMLWTMLRGFVMPLANMPAQTAAMVDIPTEMIGRASAITNIIGRVSSSFGIAVLTSMLTKRQTMHAARLSWEINPANSTAMGFLHKASAAMGGGEHGTRIGLAYLWGMIQKASFVSAIDDVFIVTAIFTLIALVPAVFLRRSKAAAAGQKREAAMAE